MEPLSNNPLYSAGCGRKLPPAELHDFLQSVRDVDGLILPETWDDCGTVEWAGPRLLETVDVVLPIGLDPETWGRIVVLHCLSDIYASAGRPLSALGILMVSADWRSSGKYRLAYQAAAAELADHGVQLSGGHTLRSETTMLGFSITGVAGKEVWTRDKAIVGSELILTKPLGTTLTLGAQGIDPSVIDAGMVDEAVSSMMLSNGLALDALSVAGVSCTTDVSGYGLLGSLLEIAEASAVSLEIETALIPRFRAVPAALSLGTVSPLAETIYAESVETVRWGDSSVADRLLMCDPQVSGGLLVAAQPSNTLALVDSLIDVGFSAARIGRVVERGRELVSVDSQAAGHTEQPAVRSRVR